MAKNNNNSNKQQKKLKEAKWFNLENETKNGILAIIFFALAAISILSYFHLAGPFGQYFFKIIKFVFGQGMFLIPLTLFLGGLSILRSLHQNIRSSTIIGMSLFVLSLLGILQIFIGDSQNKAGGYLGYLITLPLVKFLSIYGSLVFLFALLVISILITFNISLIDLINFLRRPFKAKEKPIEKVEETTLPLKVEEKGLVTQISDLAKKILPKPSFKVKIIGQKEKEEKEEKEEKMPLSSIPEEKELEKPSGYQAPPLDLLESDKEKPNSGDINANANIIKRTLQNFGIEVEMGEVNIGPTVTQYTLRPAQGVKLSKITALQSDLALALAAHPIRIEAPIPGRSLVGIEIPNKMVARVRLRNLIEQPEFLGNHTRLTLALGRNVAGNPIFADLEKMPHLLIAGATGSGKTICLNTIILSLVYRHSPDWLKFILIDPKRVEFPVYNDIPYLLTPVIVEAEKAINALRWAISEMESRFDILSSSGSRDIISYNKKHQDEPMSYIIIIIDELADLMASHGREVEGAIVRLAQMSRAVGIHLVISTQRPSVEVITGLIKANITSRIAFQVASQVDSRTIIDMAGAEKLLGNGDMLFLPGDASKPTRIQAAFVSEKEVQRVANFLRKFTLAEYQKEALEPAKEQVSFWADQEIEDDLYEDAKEVVFQAGKASASLLQRRLRIGYARAARLLDILEQKGIIGPADGAKPRQVFKK